MANVGVRTTYSNIDNISGKIVPNASMNIDAATPDVWPDAGELVNGFYSLESLTAYGLGDFEEPIVEEDIYTVSEGSFGLISDFPVPANGCFVATNIVLPNAAGYTWRLRMGFVETNIVPGATPAFSFGEAVLCSIGNIPFSEISIYDSSSDLEVSSVLKSSPIVGAIPTNGQATECSFEWNGVNDFKFSIGSQTVVARSSVANNFGLEDYFAIIIFEVG